MKTKFKFPYIYFYNEPNVVFIYRMETQDYVTVMDVSEKGTWETYELAHGEVFDTFHHEKGNRLEGRGYFINQEDLNKMVQEINKYIQLHRRSMNDQTSVHIVTPEFAAGSLKVGLKHPKMVIGFPDFFSIGPLWKLDEKKGQTFREEWLRENINFEQDDYEYQNKFNITWREIEDLAEHVSIYLWYGNNAGEQTGLRYILYLLRDKKNEIFLMNSTELYQQCIISKKEKQSIFHTGQIEPNDLMILFERYKEKNPLSLKERTQLEREWQTLSQSKEVLRIWMNGKIIGVPEDHYDPQIIKTVERLHNEQIERDFIQTETVIGEMVEQQHIDVGYFYLEYRIRHLIYSGVLELKGIPKSMRYYRIKIRP